MSDLDMRKVKKIPHPLIDEFALKCGALWEEAVDRVGKMSDEEAQRLRLSMESLTSTNCWFMEKELESMLEFALSGRKSPRSVASGKQSDG